MSGRPQPSPATPPWAGLDQRVQLLAPRGPGLASLEAFLAATHERRGEPFGAARLAGLARLSQALLADPVLRHDPATVSVAYWLRRAQLGRLVDEHARRAAAEPGVLRV